MKTVLIIEDNDLISENTAAILELAHQSEFRNGHLTDIVDSRILILDEHKLQQLKN